MNTNAFAETGELNLRKLFQAKYIEDALARDDIVDRLSPPKIERLPDGRYAAVIERIDQMPLYLAIKPMARLLAQQAWFLACLPEQSTEVKNQRAEIVALLNSLLPATSLTQPRRVAHGE